MIATQAPFYFDKAAHAYFRNGKPYIGTTTALNVLSKELTWWASGQACEVLGWKNPKKFSKEECLTSARELFTTIKGMTAEDYLKLLNKAYRAHNDRKNEAKDTGTDMHSLLEDFIRCQMAGQYPMFIDPIIEPFVKWSNANVKRFLFTELCTFSDVLYCAGTADFAYQDLNDNFVLGDFKSSEKPYFSHWAQVGGYDLQISESGGYTPEGRKIFTLEKPFEYYAIFCARGGLDKPFMSRETTRLRRAFSLCVNLYKEKMFFEEDK